MAEVELALKLLHIRQTYLLGALLIESFNRLRCLLRRLEKTVGSDDFFEVLQEAFLVRSQGLGLHHGDLLHLPLRSVEN